MAAQRAASNNSRQQTTASAIILYHIFGTPISIFSPPSTSIGLLNFLLSILWLIPYTLFYIAPYPWLIITYIIFHLSNHPDLLEPTPTTKSSKTKKHDDRIKAGLTSETRNNRVVWCVANLFPTIFITALEWIIWTQLNSPWRGLLPFDPNAEWLGGTGSDALYWVLTLLWTPLLAILGFCFFMYPCLVWVYALNDALDGISDGDWKGIGVEGDRLIDVKEVK